MKRLLLLGFLCLLPGLVRAQENGVEQAWELYADATRALQHPDSARHALQWLEEAAARCAEAEAPADEAIMWHFAAMANEQLGDLPAALASYRRSLRLAAQADDPVGAQMNHLALGVHLANAAHRDSAAVHFDAAARLQARLVREEQALHQLDELARSYAENGSPEAAALLAVAVARQAAADGDWQTVATEALYAARLWEDLDLPAEAGAALALTLRAWDHGVRPEPVALLMNNLAVDYRHAGRADSALVWHRRAFVRADAEGDASLAAWVRLNAGVTYAYLGLQDSALVYNHDARRRYERLQDTARLADAHNNIGLAHLNLGQADSAAVYLRRALSLSEEDAQGVALANLGDAYRLMGRLDSALVYLREGVRRSEGRVPTRQMGNLLNTLGYLFMQRNEPDSAAHYLHRALRLQREAENLDGMVVVYDNLAGLALQTRSFATATAYYDSAAVHFSALSRQVGDDAVQISYHERANRLYESWVQAWLQRTPELGIGEATMGALAAAERGRAQALLHLMRESHALESTQAIEPGADLPTEGLDLFSNAALLRHVIYFYQMEDSLVVWALSEGWEQGFYQTYPVSRAAVADAVAAYREHLGVDDATRSADLTALERSSRRRGGASSEEEAEALARDLSAVLLRGMMNALPLEEGDELVIIPHGPLNLLPFAALPVDSAGTPLGLRYAVSYAPSLAVLDAAAQRPGNAFADFEALVAANPEMPVVHDAEGAPQRLAPLPGAEAEGQQVAQRFAGGFVSTLALGDTTISQAYDIPTTYLQGDVATEAAVKEKLSDATFIHFATHGYAYATADRVRDSFLAFAPGPGEDGLLTVGEIMAGPSLKAELVVLSACQTGLGRQLQGEGTVGLQRAFLAKGAKALLVSLWSVSDAATQALMTAFYQYRYDEGLLPAEALRRAQQDVAQTPGFEHPRYWAAFQYVGVTY